MTTLTNPTNLTTPELRARTSWVAPQWWPEYTPHRKQQLALWAYERVPELCYGGAAGGGKTDYLLMAASQYCDYPEYAALILRKTYADLALPGAIMDRAISWWADRYGIRWRPGEHKMVWPSGAVIQFGHLGNATDHLRYQGAELHFVGIDEATQIPANQLAYLHSRLRRLKGSQIPIRYRLATNPGGVSHEYVRDEYVKGSDGRKRVYLPALLSENPGLNVEEYRERLAVLDPITRAQLESGDWDVHLAGGFFEVEKIGDCRRYDMPAEARLVRAWDLAATPDAPATDPDWTVGILLADVNGEFWVLDMKRVRLGPAAVERLIGEVAEQDGVKTRVVVEREPGSAGSMVRRHLATGVLRGFEYYSRRQSGSKYERAKPLAAGVANGLIRWNEEAPNRNDAIAEMRAFSEDPSTYSHDDVVDALALAYNELVMKRGSNMAEIV